MVIAYGNSNRVFLNLFTGVKTYLESISDNGTASHQSTASHVLGPGPVRSRVYVSPFPLALCLFVFVGLRGAKKGKGKSKEIVPLFHTVPLFHHFKTSQQKDTIN